MPLEDRDHAVRLEPLTHEISKQPPEFGLVGEAIAASEPSRKRLFEEGPVVDTVDTAEDLVDGVPRDRRRDTRLFYLPPDTQLAPPAHGGFRMRNGFRDTSIVNRPLLAEPIDGSIDFVRLVPLARAPLPDLGLGELATAEHSKAVDVRAGSGH